MATSRETKRLDSIAQSPIFSNFGETLQVLHAVLHHKLPCRFGRLIMHCMTCDARTQLR